MTDADEPLCDHRDCRPDPNRAVALYEFTPMDGGTFRSWACPVHEPNGYPALKRIDPGEEHRVTTQ